MIYQGYYSNPNAEAQYEAAREQVGLLVSMIGAANAMAVLLDELGGWEDYGQIAAAAGRWIIRLENEQVH